MRKASLVVQNEAAIEEEEEATDPGEGWRLRLGFRVWGMSGVRYKV